jgi:hypothetical protein
MKKLRLFLSVFFAFTLALSALPAPSRAADPVTLEVNGREIWPDVPPKIVGGRVMVPIRWIAEALGADVEWDAGRQTVIIFTDGERVEIPAGSVIVQGRTLVPIRAVAEALGAQVVWHPEKRIVQIAKRPARLGPANYFLFTDTKGWGIYRYPGPTEDAKQRAANHFLDRLIALLNESPIAVGAPVKEPARYVHMHLDEWVDAKGETVIGGTADLAISADYSVVRVEMSAPVPWSMTLRVDGEALRRELAQVEAVLPDKFPTVKIRTQRVSDATLADQPLLFPRVEHPLPEGWVHDLTVNPATGELFAIITGRNASQPTVWISKDGKEWTVAGDAAFGNLWPSAIGFVPGGAGGEENVRLLSSSFNGGIYRSVAGGPWELVRAYPLPEAVNKYPPARYIPDPANPSRIYASLDHDTQMPSAAGVFLSEDGGRTWTETGVNGDDRLRFVFPTPPLPDPAKEGRVLLTANVTYSDALGVFSADTEDRVLLSENAGRNWIILDDVDRLFGVAKTAEGSLYVGEKNRDGFSWLMTSRDGGLAWQVRRLPFEVLDGIAFDPAAPELMFASAEGGLYVSLNGGASWSRLPMGGTILRVDAARKLLFLLDDDEIQVYQWEARA